jgi:protoporphyrinogen oxidase
MRSSVSDMMSPGKPVVFPGDGSAFDYIVVGGGLAGLSAATVLADRCLVLEMEERPGGLARTECIDGYWFDHVLHLLHFQDADMKSEVLPFQGGGGFYPCPPKALVETSAGTALYPLQMNLGSLEREEVVRCIRDLAETCFGHKEAQPSNLQESFLGKFGRSICELFMFPYNRKLWQRSLETLSPEVSWTIAVPDFEQALRGALSSGSDFLPYNAWGWYPKGSPGVFPRGMERLSGQIASRVPNLHCGAMVVGVNTLERIVTVLDENGETRELRYLKGLISTVPLPGLVAMIEDCPEGVSRSAESLEWVRVYSVMLPIAGPRPVNTVHWRYFADEDLCFTRLVYMHAFDPDMCPREGWGLLAEIPESSGKPVMDSDKVMTKTLADIHRAEAIPGNCTVLPGRVIVNDPAYAVFSGGTLDAVAGIAEWLSARDVHVLGRYGRWEYSSMAQVIRDGLALGRSLL